MKKRTNFRSVILAATMLILQLGWAQVSVDQNWPFNPGQDYVGWDNTTTVPLEIRHDGNEQIEWYTDATRRMVLRETITNGNTAFYNNLNLSGHLAIGGNNPDPLTFLHIRRAQSLEPPMHAWPRSTTANNACR